MANAEYMLHDENNEHFPEVLRERRRFYRETSKEQDFWIVPNPAFLDAMPDVKKKVRQPCVAVVTTDKVWNDFVKLRLDRVYKGAVEGTGVECLKSNELIAPGCVQGARPEQVDRALQQVRPGLVGGVLPRQRGRVSCCFTLTGVEWVDDRREVVLLDERRRKRGDLGETLRFI